MLESEFRDWARRAQGNFEERLKALELKVGSLVLAPPRVREANVAVKVKTLAAELAGVLNGGGVTALGIAFVAEDGTVRTGWANESFDRYALAGAVSQLWLEIMDRPEKGGGEEATPASAEPGSAGEAA